MSCLYFFITHSWLTTANGIKQRLSLQPWRKDTKLVEPLSGPLQNRPSSLLVSYECYCGSHKTLTDCIALPETLKDSSKIARYAGKAARFLRFVAVLGIVADIFLLAFAVCRVNFFRFKGIHRNGWPSTLKRRSREKNCKRLSKNCMCAVSFQRQAQPIFVSSIKLWPDLLFCQFYSRLIDVVKV